MGIIKVAGKSIEVDEEGFLANPSDWNEEVAKAMAKVDNFELTPEHWEIINLLRGYYEKFQIAPAERLLVKAMGMKPVPDSDNVKNLYTVYPWMRLYSLRSTIGKGNRKYLYILFPGGLAMQACKYAGLPRIVGTI